MVNRMDQAMAHWPSQKDMLLVGDLNVCMEQPGNRREYNLETAITSHVL